jgi:hypothetical protein
MPPLCQSVKVVTVPRCPGVATDLAPDQEAASEPPRALTREGFAKALPWQGFCPATQVVHSGTLDDQLQRINPMGEAGPLRSSNLGPRDRCQAASVDRSEIAKT